MDWVGMLGTFVVPAIVGAVAGLLAPWSRWEIEKRLQRQSRRSHRVKEWRQELLPRLRSDFWSGSSKTARDVLNSDQYQSLRPHLSASVVRKLEAEATIYFGLDVRGLISDEIARIERKWRLV